MPRALWKGAVSFGMVSIPIKMYTATEEKDISFNQLHKKDHERIRYQRYCPADDEVVELSDIVKGYEISPGSTSSWRMKTSRRCRSTRRARSCRCSRARGRARSSRAAG